jgi:sterol desaturase/sphingolipid hydroxylase (fatty acid hydroxylase superfamily)
MLESLAEHLYGGAADTLTQVVDYPGSRIYWPYLLTALVIAVTALGLYMRHEGLSGRRLASGVAKTLFDRSVWLHRSAMIDYVCLFINGLLGLGVRLGLIAGGAVAGGLVYVVLVLASGRMALSVSPDIWPLAAFTILSLVLHDLANYASHYLMHRVPILWEFHKVHHSAQVLTPITAFRVHPCEILFIDFIEGLALGAASSVGLFLFGAKTAPFMIFGLNVGVFVFYLLGANLRHSHIWLPYPKWLSHVFISPAQHQIHHSSLPQHHDANFGVVFAIWDWLLGTLYVPERREKLVFGLYRGEDVEYQTVKNFYLVPLRKAWALIRVRRAKRKMASAEVDIGAG